MEKEIQKTIYKIVKDTDILRKTPNIKLELDEKELKKYLDEVIRESKKTNKNNYIFIIVLCKSHNNFQGLLTFKNGIINLGCVETIIIKSQFHHPVNIICYTPKD